MTYTIRKRKAGQEVVKKLTFYLNACKYTLPPYSEYPFFQSSENVSPSYTGNLQILSFAVGFSVWGDTNEYYAKSYTTGEMIRFKFVSNTAINILARNEFGSPLGTISNLGVFEIYHKGRADKSCFGYSQTCSNSDSYSPSAFKEVVFASAALASGNIYEAGLNFKDVNYSSSELKPGESIASRSRLSFKISDQNHNGYNLVHWSEQRSNVGTLFGKLLAQHPYFNGRKIKYSVGLRDSNTLQEPDWEERKLIIDSVNYSNGFFTGTALDSLILTEGKKAKMPLVSTAQLTAVINSASTNVQFGNALANYFGSSGNVIVRIDSELIEVTANGTFSMPIVTRGFGNSEIKDHSINATVQNCIRFVDEHVIDCITYALSTWTDTPASQIDDYSAVKALIPTAVISDYVLNSSKDVVDFINLCIFIGNLSVYFDDVTEKIVIKYISEFNISPILLRESGEIKKDSGKRNFNLKEQYTRFNLSWAPFDLTKDTEQKNYQISLTPINLSMESPQKIGEVNERKAMMLPMLTASSADYLLGAAAVNRIVSVSDQPPEIFECELDAESIGETQNSVLELGTVVSVDSSENQNKSGSIETKLYQIVQVSGDAFESFKVKMKRLQLPEPSDYAFIIEAGIYINYVLTDHFNPLIAGEYIIYIKEGAIFGSYSALTASFRTGTPSAGVTFKFIARWQILGMGGAGSDSGRFSTTLVTAGQSGGTAFEANCDCTIDNGAGLIWAGGGGATGQYYVPKQGPGGVYSVPRVGGGGGQGFGEALGGWSSDGNGNFTQRAESGNQSGAGNFGCPPGGSWGERGQGGFDNAGGFFVQSESGEAIKSNGFSVNIIAGDNALSIRGRRT